MIELCGSEKNRSLYMEKKVQQTRFILINDPITSSREFSTRTCVYECMRIRLIDECAASFGV